MRAFLKSTFPDAGDVASFIAILAWIGVFIIAIVEFGP